VQAMRRADNCVVTVVSNVKVTIQNKTGNVKMGRFYETIVTVEKKETLPICVCVFLRVRASSLAYLSCKAYAPYCDVICGLSGSTIFFDIIS
jgi:hypothetical protein